MALVLPAGAECPRRAREAMREFVRRRGGDDALAYAAQLAVSEAVSALLEQVDTEIEVRASTDADRLHVVVEGAGDHAPSLDGDLRVRLLDAVTDDVTVDVDGRAQRVAVHMTFSGLPG